MHYNRATPHTHHPINTSTKPAILVVDDDPSLLGILATILTQEGYRVLTAANGTQALDIVQHTSVLLILADRSMPQLGGVDLGRHLRSDPYTAEIPLVLMSAVPPADVSLFAAFIEKPFSREELVACIQRYQELSLASNDDETAVIRYE